METFFSEALKLYRDQNEEARNALEGLPEAALDWKPYPEANSINVLIYHLTGAERFLMGDIVMGLSTGRDREAEFMISRLTIDDLRRRMEESEGYMRRVFESLSLADLEKDRIHPRSGKTVTVAWAVMHGLEHTASHIGEIQVISHLWKERHRD